MNKTRKPRNLRPAAGAAAHVTTFYSYKGGVGRSLLLANVGWLLSERRRVLLWDLDVEAPGLHRIPALKPAEVRRGFLEWLNAWAEGEPAESGALTGRLTKELQGLVRPVPSRANLSILPAFGEGADFARLFAEGPWRRLLVDEPALGLDLFHHVLGVLGEERDHVLIDSRTGVTDIGGLLAALLPHATVLVGGYGHQSLHGLAHVKQALEEAAAGRVVPRERLGPGAALQLLHVVSPVPEDTEEAAKRKQVWTKVFGAVEPVVVPFDHRLLWSESLLATNDRACPTARAYAEVAARISGLRDRLLHDAEAVEIAEARYPGESGAGPYREAAPGGGHPRFRSRHGLTFEQRVARLLELHGYAVEPEQILGGNRVDLVARIRYGLEEQCWWVECKDHRRPVGKEVLEKLAGWVAGEEGRRQRARGMVVARAFSAAAVSYATDHPELRACTVDDLERRLYDPRSSLQSLVTAFEKGPLGRTYVRQRVLLEQRPDKNARADLLEHAHAWARGEGPRLWLLLGDYGTGKTAFFQRFTYELAQRALDDAEAPFPLAIDLKRTPNATSAETLLFEHLRSVSPDFRGGPEVLLHLLASGRCVLLLDAFDEMGVAAAGRSVEEQFRELARLAGEEPLDPRRGGRVLITCRTHFFRDQQQVKDTAAGRPAGLIAAEDSALGRVARRFNAEIDELDLFDDGQIREFIANHLKKPGEAARAADFIRETYDLPTLAPRPVLLEMIVKRLPALWREAEAGSRLTSAALYEIYTREWLEDRSGRNLLTPPKLRHELLTLLAASLWRRDDRQLHHHDLLAEVRRLAEHFPGLDFERVDIELRTAAFLVRSPDGYYRFSHKSFLEYFLARSLRSGLSGVEVDGTALDLPPLSPEVGDFFWQMPGDGAEECLAALRSLLGAPYRPRASENALRFGAWSRRYLGKPFRVERARLPGARLRGEDLRGVELPGADLTGAVLDGAQLDGAVLAGARLDRVRASRVRARGADLAGASLAGAWLPAADLSRAVLRSAVLECAVLPDAVLDCADLTDVRASAAVLTGARGDGASFERARLDRARLASTVWTGTRFTGASFDGAFTKGWLLGRCEEQPRGAGGVPLRGSDARIGSVGGHFGLVSVTLSANGTVVASGGEDGSVRLWDGSSGAERAVLKGHQGFVRTVALSADGEVVASGGEDGSVRLWDGSSGAERVVLKGRQGRVLAVALSAEGTVMASGGGDGSVRLWDGSSGAERAVLSGHQGPVLSVALSANGTVVASGGFDGSVRLWDGSSGAERAVLKGHEGRVWSVALSADGTVLTSGGHDGSVRLWDGSSGAERAVLHGRRGSVFSVALTADGTVVASGGRDESVRLWDGSSGAERAVLEGHDSIRSVALSADGTVVASGGYDGSIRLWDGPTGVERALIEGHQRQGGVWRVALSADGTVVASVGFDGSVWLWDGSSGAERAVLEGHQGRVSSVALSANGTVVASGGDDGSVRLWEGSSGAGRAVLEGHQGRVFSVALSADGTVVASGGDDDSVRLWDGSGGAGRAVLKGHERSVLSVALSADGTAVASGGNDGLVRLWDRSTGMERAVLEGHQRGVLSVALSADGTMVASGGEDGLVRLWDGSSGMERAVLEGHQGSVSSVALSADGTVVASGAEDGLVRLWDGLSGMERAVLEGHQGRVLSVALSADGTVVASGGDDGLVRLWDGSSGAERARFITNLGVLVSAVDGGWFRVSALGASIVPGLLRLHVAWGSPGSYRILPLGGLARLLNRPEHVAAVLRGAAPPPPPPIWTSR